MKFIRFVIFVKFPNKINRWICTHVWQIYMLWATHFIRNSSDSVTRESYKWHRSWAPRLCSWHLELSDESKIFGWIQTNTSRLQTQVQIETRVDIRSFWHILIVLEMVSKFLIQKYLNLLWNLKHTSVSVSLHGHYDNPVGPLSDPCGTCWHPGICRVPPHWPPWGVCRMPCSRQNIWHLCCWWPKINKQIR